MRALVRRGTSDDNAGRQYPQLFVDLGGTHGPAGIVQIGPKCCCRQKIDTVRAAARRRILLAQRGAEIGVTPFTIELRGLLDQIVELIERK